MTTKRTSYSNYETATPGYNTYCGGLYATTFSAPPDNLLKFRDISNVERMRSIYTPSVQAGTIPFPPTPEKCAEWQSFLGWGESKTPT